jgi:hypothetical protein
MRRFATTLALALALCSCTLSDVPPPGTVDATFGDPDCDGMVVNILGIRFCLKGMKSAEQRYNEQLLTELFRAVDYNSSK